MGDDIHRATVHCASARVHLQPLDHDGRFLPKSISPGLDFAVVVESVPNFEAGTIMQRVTLVDPVTDEIFAAYDAEDAVQMINAFLLLGQLAFMMKVSPSAKRLGEELEIERLKEPSEVAKYASDFLDSITVKR